MDYRTDLSYDDITQGESIKPPARGTMMTPTPTAAPQSPAPGGGNVLSLDNIAKGFPAMSVGGSRPSIYDGANPNAPTQLSAQTVQNGIDVMRGQVAQPAAPAQQPAAAPQWRGWLEPKPTPGFDPQTHKGVVPLPQITTKIGGENPLPAMASVLPADSPVRKAIDGYAANQQEQASNRAEDMRDKRMTQLMNTGSANNKAETPPSEATAGNGAPSPMQSAQAEHMIANDLREFRDAGGGIAVQRGADGKVTMTNVGTEGITNQNPLYTDINGNPTNDYTKTAQYAQGMQTARSVENALVKVMAMNHADDMKAREKQINALLSTGRLSDMMKAKAMQRQQVYNPLQDMLASQQAGTTKQGAELDVAAKKQALGKANKLDSLIERASQEQDAAKRMALLESALAMQGKDMKDSRYIKVTGGEYIGPDGMTKLKRPDGIYDAATNRFIPMQPDGAAQPAAGGKPAAPKVGDVSGGYKFKGGNPADPKSWEKV